MSEFLDEYSESLDLPVPGLESEFRKLEGALLSDTVDLLAPSEPIRLTEKATVAEAIEQLVAARRSAVVVVDDDGRLCGIFTERDVVTRVIGMRCDPQQTPLAQVMTRAPESLSPRDRICYAVNRMHIQGYRSMPLVDDDGRPVGVVTVTDVVKWLAEIFPEAVLNLRPGDRIKKPKQMDSG